MNDLPHVRAYRRMMIETAPLLESKVRPSWVDRLEVTDAVVSLALAGSEDKKRDSYGTPSPQVEKKAKTHDAAALRR